MTSLTDNSEADLARALAEKRKGRRRASPRKVAAKRAIPTAPGQRQPREQDERYLGFLRQHPCIACLIEGPPPAGARTNMEAAHQKLAIASRGWKEGGGGVRTHDRRCVGLCRWHHQDAPNACDKAQRRFWDRLNIGDAVADLCTALRRAFPDHEAAVQVLRDFAAAARKDHP
jgi:hypothetical protein